jgi:hypothetical protein
LSARPVRALRDWPQDPSSTLISSQGGCISWLGYGGAEHDYLRVLMPWPWHAGVRQGPGGRAGWASQWGGGNSGEGFLELFISIVFAVKIGNPIPFSLKRWLCSRDWQPNAIPPQKVALLSKLFVTYDFPSGSALAMDSAHRQARPRRR